MFNEYDFNSFFGYDAGVTEEQFQETWTRQGATNVATDGNVVIAKSRM